MTTPEFTPDETMRELILRFLDGTASDGDIALMRAWLEQGEANRRYFDEVNTTFQATVTLNRFNLQSVNAAWSSLAQKIDAEKTPSYPSTHTAKTARLTPYLKIAASVCFVALSGFLTYRFWPVAETTQPYYGSVVRNAEGNNTRVLLPDGSVVWLNINSILEYPEQFGKTSREVVLKGEGFFDVRKGSIPFIVHAEHLDVQVKGTRFNVEAYSDAPTVRTTLEEGKVELKVANHNDIYVMKPGDQITLNKQQNEITRSQVNPANFSAWKEDKLIFDNVSLDAIVSQLENRYKVNILVESIGAKGERMSMTIDHESLDEVLEMIRLSSHLRMKKEKNRIILFE